MAKPLRLLTVLTVLVILALVACQQLGRHVADPKMMLHAILGKGIETPDTASLRQQMQLPQGYGLSLYAKDLRNARILLATSADDLLLSQPREGKVSILKADSNGDAKADTVHTLLDGLDRPHGLALYQQWLYIAEGDAIGRVAFDQASGQLQGSYQRVLEGLPNGGNHWTKSIAIADDGWVYISVGSSCNVCEEKDSRRAAVLRMRPDGSGLETYATGLRNAVAIAFSPLDGELYAADISRDLLGDNFPPDELNVVKQGGFYGWPYLNGDNIADPNLGDALPENLDAIVPVLDFPAHNSPLSVHFLRHPQLQADFPKSAIVALHGSWNRSVPEGYSLVRVSWAKGEPELLPFLSGFLHQGSVSGRPVSVVEDSQGALYFSDDYGNAVYRLAKGAASTWVPEAAVENANQSKAGAQHEAVQVSVDAETAAAAEALFQRFACASCHYSDAPGRLGLKALKGRYDVDDLAEFFLVPTPPMPKFPMSKKEREQLASWLLSQAQ